MGQQVGRAGVELPRARIGRVIRTSVTQIEEDPHRVKQSRFRCFATAADYLRGKLGISKSL